MKKVKKAFTLVELLAVIIILSLIMMIAVPQVLNVINSNKKNSFFVSAKAIARQVEYQDWANDNFTLDTLNNIDLTGISSTDYDVNKSYVYVDNGVFKINLVGIGKFAGLYACGISKNNLQTAAVTTTPCSIPEIMEAPQLVQGMIPVYYDNATGEWKKADITNTNNDWYDYTNQKWANAVTVSPASRSNYQTAEVGKPILMNDINTMFVWIPRFSYEIPSGTGAREILIHFETKDTPKSTGNAVSSYYTHPAFTFGDTELGGIWVGKFETSGTLAANSITIKPDVASLRSQTIKAMYNGVKTYMQGNNTYGFSNSDNDTHMMLNTEWGAVAYLSQSKYGKYGNSNFTGVNKEVYRNNSSGFFTGRSMGAPTNGVLTPSVDYIANGYYTYDGKCATIYAGLASPCTIGSTGQVLTDKTLSYGASTTGTIYGIYDMSGGSWEYTMGMYKPNPVGSGIADSSGYSTVTTNSQYDLLTIDKKYYNQYLTTNVNTGSIKGDATLETIGWYGDYGSFLYLTVPWIYRGSEYYYTNISGIFAYGALYGSSFSDISFRITLAPNP